MKRDKYFVPEPRLEPPPEPKGPRCPCCGAECDDIYYDKNGISFGCENCISIGSAWECPECF